MAKKPDTDKTTAQDVEEQLLNALFVADPGTDEFQKILDQYKEFCATKPEKEERIGLKPWIPVIGNLTGIGLMGLIEARGHIFTSKALSLFGAKLK